MEQYWMPKDPTFNDLRTCLNSYSPLSLEIGLISETDKVPKVREKLEGRTLDFRKDSSGLHLLVDSDELFRFPLRRHPKGFSIAYERFDPATGEKINLKSGIDPYEPNLPEPKQSILRTVLDEHSLQIAFKGRIRLEFHSWLLKPSHMYWTVIKTN